MCVPSELLLSVAGGFCCPRHFWEWPLSLGVIICSRAFKWVFQVGLCFPNSCFVVSIHVSLFQFEFRYLNPCFLYLLAQTFGSLLFMPFFNMPKTTVTTKNAEAREAGFCEISLGEAHAQEQLHERRALGWSATEVVGFFLWVKERWGKRKKHDVWTCLFFLFRVLDQLRE